MVTEVPISWKRLPEIKYYKAIDSASSIFFITRQTKEPDDGIKSGSMSLNEPLWLAKKSRNESQHFSTVKGYSSYATMCPHTSSEVIITTPNKVVLRSIHLHTVLSSEALWCKLDNHVSFTFNEYAYWSSVTLRLDVHTIPSNLHLMSRSLGQRYMRLTMAGQRNMTTDTQSLLYLNIIPHSVKSFSNHNQYSTRGITSLIYIYCIVFGKLDGNIAPCGNRTHSSWARNLALLCTSKPDY